MRLLLCLAMKEPESQRGRPRPIGRGRRTSKAYRSRDDCRENMESVQPSPVDHGQLIQTLLNQFAARGRHRARWHDDHPGLRSDPAVCDDVLPLATGPLTAVWLLAGLPLATVPRRRAGPEDGRCPARTNDLLLVRHEQLLLSTDSCPYGGLGRAVDRARLPRFAAVCRFRAAF